MIKNLKTILNAHIAAFETTRHEAGKVLEFAIKEGQKFRERARSQADDVAGNLAGAADDRLSAIEQVVQKGVNRVIHRIGLPTAKDINALSRRVEALAEQVNVRARAKKTARRRPVARRAA